MKILGIDYGRKKIGLAIADGPLAEPMAVVRYSDSKILREKIKKIIEEEKIERVVVGVSFGKMGNEQKKFAREIGAETFDESLTTKEAKRLSLEAGISRKKRRGMEDAFAACVMLQCYLDSNV